MATTNMAPNAGANALVNSKLKYFAAGILDSIPYIRMAKAYFKDDVKGKKAGMTYRFFVPDPGIAEAGTTDLDITDSPKDVWELPVNITLVDGKTSVALSAWNKLTSVEDFIRDIVDTRARTLGCEIEASVIKDNWFRADSAIVDNSGTPSTKVFALLAARLRGIRSAGKKVGFAHPDVFAGLGDVLLGKFLPSEEMKKIYGDTVIAHAFGSEWIEENYMPFITVGGTAPTVTSVNFSTGVVTGTNLIEGTPFTVALAAGKIKTIDLVGKKTNEDYVFIVTNVNAAGTSGKIQLEADQIRFMNEANAAGDGAVKLSNPTLGADAVASDGTSLIEAASQTCAVLLSANSTYAVVQVRDADALEFDTYEFDEVAGAKNDKLKACEISVQSVEQGSVITRNSVLRIDVPYMSKLVLTKLARVAFIKV